MDLNSNQENLKVIKNDKKIMVMFTSNFQSLNLVKVPINDIVMS